jgi:CheY-like chemotaxis protein
VNDGPRGTLSHLSTSHPHTAASSRERLANSRMPETMSDRPASASVLVVEDNDTTRSRMATVLRGHGYDVVEAMDGLQALQNVSRRPFDAILLDLVLPHVDGWQFRATQLRHPELASIPTVIVTVQPLREPDRYSLRTNEVLRKPFEDLALLQAVERACRTKQLLAPSPDTDAGALFWSRRGEIACGDHAPDATSLRWRDERWAAIPASAGQGRIVYRCQHCPGDGSPIDRSHRTLGRHGSSTPRATAEDARKGAGDPWE